MNEVIEAAKRLRTCCDYDSGCNCKDCVYYVSFEEIGACKSNRQFDKDIRMIIDFVVGMEDDGK